LVLLVECFDGEGRDSNKDTYKVGSFGFAVGVGSWNVGSDGHRLPVGSCSSGIDHALVWTSAVTVNLVKSHRDHSTGGDLWQCAAVRSNHSWDSSGNIVGSTSESLTA